MNYLLTKFLGAMMGINKALAAGAGGTFGNGENTNGGGTYNIPNPLGSESISQIINNIAYYLSVYIAPPIVTLMILFAAFQILTAGENPEKLKSGREIILWTCVGYGIVLISWGITSIIQQLLSGY